MNAYQEILNKIDAIIDKYESDLDNLTEENASELCDEEIVLKSKTYTKEQLGKQEEEIDKIKRKVRSNELAMFMNERSLSLKASKIAKKVRWAMVIVYVIVIIANRFNNLPNISSALILAIVGYSLLSRKMLKLAIEEANIPYMEENQIANEKVESLERSQERELEQKGYINLDYIKRAYNKKLSALKTFKEKVNTHYLEAMSTLGQCDDIILDEYFFENIQQLGEECKLNRIREFEK